MCNFVCKHTMSSNTKDHAKMATIIADTTTHAIVPLHSGGASTPSTYSEQRPPPKRWFAWRPPPSMSDANLRSIDLSPSTSSSSATRGRSAQRLLRHLWPGTRMFLLKSTVACAAVYATKRTYVWDTSEQTAARWQPFIQWPEVDRKLMNTFNAAVKYSFGQLHELPQTSWRLMVRAKEFGYFLGLTMLEIQRRVQH